MAIEKKTTLKDIAEHCGVSPTVVSAVINNRRGRISCSAEKREMILNTSRELNYQVNIFARTMKLKRVPIVGVMLHCDQQRNRIDSSLFVEAAHAKLTLAFNKNDIEVLFIPYFSEEEQLARLTKLNGYGLIGGVVTNIIPQSHLAICRYLVESGLPYMVLGKPRMKNIYCAYQVNSVLNAKIMEIAAMQGYRNVFQVIDNDGSLEFRRYPFIDDYMWTTPAFSAREIHPEAEDTLYAVHGISTLNELEKQHIALKNILVVDAENMNILTVPPVSDMLLVTPQYIFGVETDYIVNNVCRWMKFDQQPETFERKFADSEQNILQYLPQKQGA